MQELLTIWQFIRDFGVAGMLFLTVAALVTGKAVIPRWIYDRLLAENAELKAANMVLDGKVDVALSTLDAAVRVVEAQKLETRRGAR